MNDDLAFLYTTLLFKLKMQAPVLSGETKRSIKVQVNNEKEVVIIIEPEVYDVDLFLKTGQIKHDNITWHQGMTMQKYYANDVNNWGGFRLHNKSEHWVNRCCYEACFTLREKLGGWIHNELDLDYGFKSGKKYIKPHKKYKPKEKAVLPDFDSMSMFELQIFNKIYGHSLTNNKKLYNAYYKSMRKRQRQAATFAIAQGLGMSGSVVMGAQRYHNGYRVSTAGIKSNVANPRTRIDKDGNRIRRGRKR